MTLKQSQRFFIDDIKELALCLNDVHRGSSLKLGESSPGIPATSLLEKTENKKEIPPFEIYSIPVDTKSKL